MVRVVRLIVDVTSIEDKVTFAGSVNCVVDDARAPFVPLMQVITGCVVEAITC